MIAKPLRIAFKLKSKIKNAMEKHQIESFTIEQSIQLSSGNNKTKTSHQDKWDGLHHLENKGAMRNPAVQQTLV